jgi:cysteine desulfurase
VLNTRHDSVLPQTVSVRFRGVSARCTHAPIARPPRPLVGLRLFKANQRTSHVLLAQGLTIEDAQSSIRISFGRFTTESEIDAAATTLANGVAELAAITRAV